MKETILNLMTRGDYHLKEAKSKFWVRQDEQCGAACSCCKAIKKYLDAYKHYLYPGLKPLANYHVLFRTLTQRDPHFQRFYEKIFQVKCFAEESKREKENFFLYDDEMNNAIKISLEIRDYISRKIKIDTQFLSEYLGTTFMAI